MTEWHTVNVPITINVDGFFDAVIYSGFDAEEHWRQLKVDAFKVVTIEAVDPDTGKWRRAYIERSAILRALDTLAASGSWTTLGADVDDVDATFADALVQIAVFGDIVYG